MRMINNDAYKEAAALEAQARADMMEREAAKRRNEDFVRQSRPGSYLTTESAEDENKRLAAEGWRRGAFGTLSRDTGAGTESMSYGVDGTARYSYYPSEPKEQPTNWNEALRQQQQRQAAAESGDRMAESMYDQMREVEGRVVAAGEERDKILNDGLVAAMRFAADTENSGRLPRSACELLTRQFGMDGMNTGVFDAGYVPEDMTVNINGQPTKVKKGSFGITLAGRDQAGNVTYNPMFLSPTDVYAVMNANRSQFSDEQIAARRDALLQSGYSEKELAGLVDMNFSMNRARGRAEQMRRTAEQNEFNRRLQLQKAVGTRGLSFEERMALEEQKNSRLATQEAGRTARAKQNEDMAKARLGASMGKTLRDLKLNLGLDDAQFEKLQSTLASTITNAFSQEQPSDKAEKKQGDNSGRTVQEIRANPQDGDELPLKGGGKARYIGKTKKWEAAQ